MYGTRSRLFQEHMKGVLKEAGYAALKVCHQVYHCLETDSMAAIHGHDIIAEGEPERLDRLDEVLKRLVVVEVLDRVGPGAAEHGQNLKRHIVYINGKGFEWLEHPKHLAAIIRKRSQVGAKPRSFPRSKDLLPILIHLHCIWICPRLMISSRSALYVDSRRILKSMCCFRPWCAMRPHTIPCLMASLVRSLDCCSYLVSDVLVWMQQSKTAKFEKCGIHVRTPSRLIDVLARVV